MKFVSDSGREFYTYEDAMKDECKYHNEVYVDIYDVIKNIILYDEYINVISIDINDFKNSFETAYKDSSFIKIKDSINEDTIPTLNRYYTFYLFLPRKPGMYRYDVDYNDWRSFSADKDAWEEWKKLIDKGLI